MGSDRAIRIRDEAPPPFAALADGRTDPPNVSVWDAVREAFRVAEGHRRHAEAMRAYGLKLCTVCGREIRSRRRKFYCGPACCGRAYVLRSIVHQFSTPEERRAQFEAWRESPAGQRELGKLRGIHETMRARREGEACP